MYTEIKAVAARRLDGDKAHDVATRIIQRYLEEPDMMIRNFPSYIGRTMGRIINGNRKENRRASHEGGELHDSSPDLRERPGQAFDLLDPRYYCNELCETAEGRAVLCCIALGRTRREALFRAVAQGVPERYIRDHAREIVEVWRVTHAYAGRKAPIDRGSRGRAFREIQVSLHGAGPFDEGGDTVGHPGVLELDGNGDEGGN